MATRTTEQEAPAPKAKRSFQFPSAVTTLVIVTVLVWIAALFIRLSRAATTGSLPR